MRFGNDIELARGATSGARVEPATTLAVARVPACGNKLLARKEDTWQHDREMIAEQREELGRSMKGERLPWWYAVAFFLVLGVAMRILGAWCFSLAPSPDFGTASLMAKHMAEGKGFPVFFYGQAYMGSFEVALSAVFCRILGVSGFAVNLGTALLGILTLPVVYLWGKGAGGRNGGLAARACCAIGSGYFFQYESSQRGGYAAALLAGTLVTWMAARATEREMTGQRVGPTWFFLMGLAAGIGWWSSQLVTVALATSALIFVGFLRQRTPVLRALWTVPAFFLGGLPFWIWNARNEWATFGFRRSFGRTPLRDGIELFFSERLPSVLGIAKLPGAWGPIVAVIYVVVVLAAFVPLVRAIRLRKLSGKLIYLLAAAVFCCVLLLLFSTSHYATIDAPRYLLPVIPVAAILFGAGIANLVSSFPGVLGWLPLVMVVIFQAVSVPGHCAGMREHRAYWKEVARFAEFLREERIENIYAPYAVRIGNHGFNFALREEFCFADTRKERYPPYAKRLELAESVAVLNNHGDIDDLIRATAAAAKHGGLTNLLVVTYDMKPCPDPVAEVDPAGWREVLDFGGRDIRAEISDRNIGTGWRFRDSAATSEWVEVTFARPTAVSGLRLFSKDRLYPGRWHVAALRSETGGLEQIMTPVAATRFFWSGPRPYWSGEYYRLECWFPPRTVSGVRIYLESPPRRPESEITELQIFGPSVHEPETQSEQEALPQLAAVLEDRETGRLYSDRWVANRVYESAGGRISVAVEPSVFKDAEAGLSSAVVLDPRTAILVRREDAACCRGVLQTSGIAMRETAVGPWVLFDFTPELWSDLSGKDTGLYWAGFSCLVSGPVCGTGR